MVGHDPQQVPPMPDTPNQQYYDLFKTRFKQVINIKISYQSTKNSIYPCSGLSWCGSPISTFTPTKMSVLDLRK